MKKTLLPAVLLGTAAGLFAAAAPDRPLPKDVELLIPRQAVKVGWVLPPSPKNPVRPEIFDVDKAGDPWFGVKGRSIANPLKGVIFVTDEPFQQFAWTGDNAFLVTNGRSLGFLTGVAVKGRPERLIRTAFKPLIELPGRNYRLFPGGRRGLFLAGLNAKTQKHEVVYIEVKNRVASVRKILESDAPVNHVAGGGNRAWVAMGRVVAQVDLKAKTLEPVFAHPTEPIREFVHAPNAGFFYATASGLGFFKKGLQYQFMSGPNLRIRLKNSRLYVLLDKGQGLLRIEGLQRFAGLNPEKKAAS